MSDDEEVDEEEMQLDYEDKCNEVVELQSELRAAKMESQQLRLRLQAATKNGGSAAGVVNGLPAVVPPAPSIEQQRAQELLRMVSWLAEHVVLDEAPPEILDVGFEVPIGGRTVHLQRVRQWSMVGVQGGAQLRLSVPVQHQECVGALLATAKAHDNMPDANALKEFAANWDLVPGELTTVTHSRAEPAVLLAHRSSMDGILVATWPTREALEAFRALHATNGETPKVGNRVEVEYDGQWYLGVLHAIDAAGKASVKCDVDEPGVHTIAPLHRVKRIPQEGSNAKEQPSAAAGTTPAAPADRSEALRQRLMSEGAAQPEPENNGSGSRATNHRRTRSAT